VVFGSGHDVRPVVELARTVDFRVTVVSFRGGLATPERFPEADRVCSASPPEIREELVLDEETYAVVMTHNFVDDRLVLDELLASEVPYIGLMGPRERFEEMVAEFAAEGREFTDAELERIYTPIGLNLGGGTPYEIAMSIVAEAQAVASGREPTHLRQRESPIHDRIDLDS
jgi:xanthine dehydrogenase accessory factor